MERQERALKLLPDSITRCEQAYIEHADAQSKVEALSDKIPVVERKIALLQAQLQKYKDALVEADDEVHVTQERVQYMDTQINALCIRYFKNIFTIMMGLVLSLLCTLLHRSLDKSLLKHVLSYLYPLPSYTSSIEDNSNSLSSAFSVLTVCKYWMHIYEEIRAETLITMRKSRRTEEQKLLTSLFTSSTLGGTSSSSEGVTTGVRDASTAASSAVSTRITSKSSKQVENKEQGEVEDDLDDDEEADHCFKDDGSYNETRLFSPSKKSSKHNPSLPLTEALVQSHVLKQSIEQIRSHSRKEHATEENVKNRKVISQGKVVSRKPVRISTPVAVYTSSDSAASGKVKDAEVEKQKIGKSESKDSDDGISPNAHETGKSRGRLIVSRPQTGIMQRKEYKKSDILLKGEYAQSNGDDEGDDDGESASDAVLHEGAEKEVRKAPEREVFVRRTDEHCKGKGLVTTEASYDELVVDSQRYRSIMQLNAWIDLIQVHLLQNSAFLLVMLWRY